MRKERELCRVNQQLEGCEQVIAQFQRRVTELEQPRAPIHATPRIRIKKISWKKGRKAPCEMSCYTTMLSPITPQFVMFTNSLYKHLLLVSNTRQPNLQLPLGYRQYITYSLLLVVIITALLRTSSLASLMKAVIEGGLRYTHQC